MVAMESGLIRGMIQGLPAPGSVMSAAQLRDFIELAGVVLKVVYRVEQVSPEVPVEAARPALRAEVPAPSSPLGPPAEEKAGPNFRVKKNRWDQVKKPKLIREKSASVGKRSPGLLIGLIKDALQASNGMPMSIKKIAEWVQKHRAAEVVKYPNVRDNLYQACLGLKRQGALTDDVEQGVTVYYLVPDKN